jgi:glycosyltransferase involved in cell wall biosynthesis
VASGFYSFGANFHTAGRAMEVAHQFKPDLIHTNSSKTNFGVILAWRMGVPHVWHFREFIGGQFSTAIAFSLGDRLSRRFIEVSSSAVVVISEALKKHLALRDPRIPVHMVYNGVMSLDLMKKTVLTPLPDSKTLVLAWIGRFDESKHPIVALEAMRILKERKCSAKLIMAGAGTEEQVEALEKFISVHQLGGAVEMRGFVEDISEVYAQSHALIMTSTGDAFGRVTAEAMAYGRAVIGADSCATSELVEHETDGLLFRPNDPQDLAEKISRLLEDRILVARLGANAAEKAKREFTIEKYGSRMEQIFYSVINGKRPAQP